VGPIAPELLQLAQRLRQLREQQWPDVRLTQAALAAALAEDDHLAPATVSSWESLAAPKLPPSDRLTAYARFFATRRSLDGDVPHLVPPDSFTDTEQAAYQKLETELLALREAIRKPGLRTEVAVRRSWHFNDAGPLTIVCAQLPEGHAGALADPADPNYTEAQALADLDALIELHGHVRAENPEMNVFFKASPKVVPDDLSGHVVLLGGIAWNTITERLSDMTVLPVRQIRDPAVESGEIFVADLSGKDQKFLPQWRDSPHANLKEDVGLLARTPNPLNSNRSLIICNGVHSRGVLGAVRTLTDAQLRDSNEEYLASNFEDAASFVILMRVPVIAGHAMTPDFNVPGCVLYQWSSDAGSLPGPPY
jgi:hypothetical protein